MCVIQEGQAGQRTTPSLTIHDLHHNSNNECAAHASHVQNTPQQAANTGYKGTGVKQEACFYTLKHQLTVDSRCDSKRPDGSAHG